MFEGMPAEQFHQFLVSRTTLPMIPLSFPLDQPSSPPTTTTTFPTFDPSLFPYHHHHHHHHHQSHLLHHLHQKQDHIKIINASDTIDDPWSTNEVLALLRIRSTSIDNWFPDFTWEHVSRKMGELGFKRSAEKCKEKYEEETTRNLNGIIGHNNVKLHNKFLISELDEQIFYQDDGDQSNLKPIVRSEEEAPAPVSCDHHHREEKMMKAKLQQIIGSEEEEEEGPIEKENQLVDTPPSQEVVNIVKPKKSKKRKSREDKFEMFKGFCVEIVHKMIEQQEELHNKLIQEMLSRDEEKIAKEEAWKKQEMERVNKEIEIRAHEQVVAGDRQAIIIELLNKFTPEKPYPLHINFEDLKQSNIISPQMPNSPPSLVLPESNNSTSFAEKVSKVSQIRRKPNLSSSDEPSPKNPTCTSDAREDIGKRWPRDEVQALIDMRCSLYNSNMTSNVNHDDKELSGASSCNKQGGSLWEKISQGMSELGYTRSAKRCKEKWENINKYYRKTKDVNKKRSVDSRTCPYFHQLSSLYSQGALFAPSDESASHSTSLENNPALPETLPETAI